MSVHMSDMSGKEKKRSPSHRDQSVTNPLNTESHHHGGSFQKYMEGKIRKLDAQFRQGTSSTVEDPEHGRLFQGISIHVNGYTEPSHAELKRLMKMYGGSFQNYYSRSSVTHIVCSHLPDAKVKQMEKEKDRPPVVKPEWITESIRAGKLLSIGEYLLESLRPGGPGQQTLQWGRRDSPFVDDGRLSRAQEIAKHMRQNCQMLKGPPKSSKDDPNFIDSFYQASRLHFIGTWKIRLEKLMLSGVSDNSPRPVEDDTVERVVIHVDMDCFFASVAEASHPEFKGLPLAVCHSNAKGSGEISSANYEARTYGIHASMCMAQAKELCPMLVVVPYEFEKYESVSESMYRILLTYTRTVQAISCDEAYLDVTGLGDPMDIATRLRSDIQKATSCCASAGIGSNMLLARIATAKAKPNGQFYLKTENALQELACLDVQELPGVGWRTGQKLRDAGLHKVGDIQRRTKEELQELIGKKAGCVTYDYAFGQDDRRVVASSAGLERKSVGAEINWGIRFESERDAETFLRNLSQHVYDRLQELKMKGKNITLKIKKKRQGAGEPRKFLGMGVCDSLSRSSAITGRCTVDTIYNTSLPLLRSLQLHFADIRGMGLSMTKLEPLETSSPATRQRNKPMDCFVKSRESHPKPRKMEYALHASAIDQDVLSELPTEIQEEIRREYGLKTGDELPKQETSKRPLPRSERDIVHSNTGTRSRVPFIEYDPMRMSQIDTSVLNELPVSLQQEVLKSMEPFQGGKVKKRKNVATKTSPQNTLNRKTALEKNALELEGQFLSLKQTLPESLQAVAEVLHAGNVVGFLSGVEKWLSKRDSIDQTHVSTVVEIICCECRSNASVVPLDGQWTLCRGIKRIFSTYLQDNESLIKKMIHTIEHKHSLRFLH